MTKKEFYNILVEETGYQDSYEDFDSMTSTPEGRKEFYDILVEETEYEDDYEWFESVVRGESNTQPTPKPISAVQSPQGGFYDKESLMGYANAGNKSAKPIASTTVHSELTNEATPKAPSAPKAEDISITKPTAMTNNVSVRPVSAIQKGDGTPYKAEELQATADKQQAESTAQVEEQPTVQSSAEIEAEIDEKIANQGYLSSASVEADKAKLAEAKAREAEGDQKAEDGESDFISTLQGLYGKKGSTPGELKTYTANYQLPIDLPTNFDSEYYSRYGEDASRVIFSYAKAKAVEDNGGNPLSDMQLIDLNNKLSRMSEDDVAKLIGEEGTNKLMNLVEKYKSASRDDAVTYGAVDKLFAMPGMSEQISNILLYPGGSGKDEATVKELLKGDVTASTLASQNDYQGLASYINAKVLGVEQYFGKGALDYYMQNPDTNKDTKSKAILNYANAIRQAIYKVNLPQSAEGYLVRNAQDMAKRGQIGTTDGDARMNDMLSHLAEYGELMGMLSDEDKAIVLERANKMKSPYDQIKSIEDACFGGYDLNWNIVKDAIVTLKQQQGVIQSMDDNIAKVEKVREDADGIGEYVLDKAVRTVTGPAYYIVGDVIKDGVHAWTNPDLAFANYAMEYYKDAKDILEDGKDSGFVGFMKGLGNSIATPRVWDFGARDLQMALAIKAISEKWERNEELTEAETMFMDAVATNIAAQALTKQSTAYQVGSNVGGSIPYLIEMALPVKGGKTIASKVYKWAVNRVERGALKNIIKYASKLTGGITEAGIRTATIGVGRVAEGATKRLTPEINLKQNEKGGVAFDGFEAKPDKSVARAIGESAYEKMVEYWVEKAGRDIFKALGVGKARKFANDFLKRKGIEIPKNTDWNAALKAMAYNGSLEEFGEEMLTAILQTPVNETTLDANEKTGVFNADNITMTALTTYTMSALLNAPNVASRNAQQKKFEQQLSIMSDALDGELGESWNDWKSAIDNATYSEVATIMDDIRKDKNLAGNQKELMLRYAVNKNAQRELMSVAESESIKDETRPSINAQKRIEESASKGASITDVNEGFDAQEQELITGESLAKMMGVESASVAKDMLSQRYGTDHPTEIAIEVANDASLNDSQRKVILDYYSAVATNIGKQEGLEMERMMAEMQAEQGVKTITNNDMGGVVTAQSKVDDSEVKVIAGEVAINDDGSINKDKSDESIVVQKADGTREMISPEAIHNVVMQSVGDVMADARAKINAEYAKMADARNGRVNVGDVVNYGFFDQNTNEQSVKMTVTNIGKNDKGEDVITLVETEREGAEPVTMTREQLEVGRKVAYKANNKVSSYNGPVGLPSMAKQATQAETTQEQSTFKGDAPTETEQVVESTAPQGENVEITEETQEHIDKINELLAKSSELFSVYQDNNTKENRDASNNADAELDKYIAELSDKDLIDIYNSGYDVYFIRDEIERRDLNVEPTIPSMAKETPQVESTEVVEESTERPMEISPGVAVRVGGVAGVATSFSEDGKVIVETEDGKILPYDESEVEVVGETTETTGTTETTMSDESNESDGTNGSNNALKIDEIKKSGPLEIAEKTAGGIKNTTDPSKSTELTPLQARLVRTRVRRILEQRGTREQMHDALSSVTHHISTNFPALKIIYHVQDAVNAGVMSVDEAMEYVEAFMYVQDDIHNEWLKRQVNDAAKDSVDKVSEVANDANESQSTASPLGAIPVDAKGEPMYESAPVEATIADIYNDPDLDEDEADAFVQAKIDGATKRIAQLEKKKPKMGESKVAFKEAKAKWREQLEAEQASLAYWQGVQEAVPEMRRKERAKRQMEADIAQREREQQERAEQSRRAEERGRNRGDYRKAIAGWEDTPSSFHEYVAQALLVGNHKMRWNDNGSTRGLGSHTTGRRGVNRRGEVVTVRNDESRAMGWLIDDRGGLSPEALADKLWNEYTGSYGEEMSEGSPLDVLLDVVTSMPTPQMMWDYVKGEHDARMEAEQGTYEEQYSAEEIEAFERDAMYREKYGVSEEEYWANEAQWDEFIESREMSAEELGNYDNFVAEERIKEEHGRRNQENAEDEQRTDNSESEGGVEVLSGTQPDITRGDEDVAGESEGVDGNGVESNDVASEEAAELSEEDRQAIENMPIPTLKRQIKDTATTLFNVSQTSDQWQAENKDKIERAKLLLAYAKQELARKERLKKSNKWGIKVGNTATPFDVVRKMFEEFNSNEDIAQLFEKVAKVFETLPIKIVFSDTIGGKSTQGWFSPTTGTLKLPGYFVYGGGISEQNKAETILHEMIHAVTTYALYINEKPYLQTELGFRLSDDMHAAIRQLKRIYASIANDKDFKGEYGAVSVHEMIAELSNVQFREKLKKKGLWETIVDAIKQLFGITPSNALEGAEAALEYMLNNFDRSQWEKMAGMGEKRGKQMRIGVEKMGSSFEYFTGSLTDLISIAKKAVKGLFKKNITPASSRLVGDLKELGIDISEEYKHVVDNYAIRHTFNNHGGKGESLRGQIPINNSDFELIPDIVNNYDNITTIVTRKGLPGILYEKTFEDGTTVYVEEIHNKHKELTLVSMRKIKRPTLLGANRTNEPTPIPSSGKSSASKGSDNIGDVQGLEDYSAEELKEIAREYIEDVIAESGFDAEVVDLAIYGSRRRGDGRDDSDLDIVVEYSGNAREDDLFNALNDAETQLEIDGVKVDINPITKSKSGTLGEFMERVREYDESNGSTKESQPLSRGATAPLSEQEGSLEDDGLLFRDGEVFYSNAEEAVRNIKQEKATPEQWLAMIQKNGGLKAGEDKWLGLSEWLNEKGKRKDERGKSVTLTKEEVLEFIKANQIVVEEVRYEQGLVEDDGIAEYIYNGFEEIYNELRDNNNDLDHYELVDYAWSVYCDQSPSWINEAIDAVAYSDGTWDLKVVDSSVYENHATEEEGVKAINSTRMSYTTEGLENKREIALVVPTINPYNQSDEIHFGDAGGGRAVAWVRFGETTDEDGNRVLVIDEIQSKRHQDGREKGYRDADVPNRVEDAKKAVAEAEREFADFRNAMQEKYDYDSLVQGSAEERKEGRKAWRGKFTPEEMIKYDQLHDATIDARNALEEARQSQNRVPDAPFDKNWQELAMKRMLRYAAENGFDKVAWTTGAQQAERYSMGRLFNDIEREDNPNLEGRRFVLSGANAETFQVDDNGNITASTISEAEGKSLQEVVGKEMAIKMMNLEDGDLIENEDLRIGGEGMKGFYDKMLPSFMNKYGKKWGVKVGETTMPNIGDGGLTMHSIDVTDAMRESVMEGQPMFRDGSGALSDADLSYTNDPFAKALGKSQRSRAKQAKFAERERKYMRNRVAELAEKMGISDRVTVASSEEIVDSSERKARAKGWFDTRTGKIVINISNHTSVADVERTLLHEAVAHYGLRQLFGKQFDTFLDNVYLHADAEVRAQIIELAKKHGWDFRTATEEYLAGLAEDTNFEYLEYQTSFWMKIKRFFMDMLESIGWDYKGPELSDNELRYLLWRSYENMVNPGRHRSILGKAEDVAKQYALGVGNYSADAETMSHVAESGAVMVDNQGNPIDEDGRLIVEQVSSIDEITDADFDSPTRSIQLPSIPPKVDEAIGANGKPIVIKKNVFEKNKKSHKDLTPKDSRAILLNTLYSPDLYGQNQKITRPYNWILIHLADTNTAVLVEVNENKDNVEIVNWHYINDDAIERKKKQAIREGGLILTLESAAADTSNFLPSADKGNNNNSEKQENNESNGSNGSTNAERDTDEGILFRDGESDGTREEYNRRVRRPNRSGSVGKWDNLGWRMKEAYQDSMLSLKELQDVIAKKYGLKEIPSWMNAYLQENLMSSRNKAASDVYMRDFYNPMMKEVQALIKKGVKYEDLVNYMIAKHGLERNVVMAERDAKRAADEAKKKGEDWQKAYDEALKENRKRDYSGLTALTGEESVMTAEKVAEKMVEEFEGAHETDALWEKVNAATKETLRKSYEGGLMSKETYESTDAMYEHYIPLRGWDTDIASDVYEYLMSDRPLLSPALKTAKGRTSLADDPIATIGMMADSTIAQANRNKMKQAFYYFAVNNPSDVVTISKQWYVYDEVTKKWQPRSADIPLDASSEEIATIVEEFEARMEELARDGKAKRKSQGLDLDLRTVGREGEEHTVRVKVNGEEYCIYVNGSPRAAQALNGLTNPEMFDGAFMEGTKKVNNYLAQVFTSKNPEFVFSNMSRDLMWATGAVAVKENAKYNEAYHKNINKIFWSGTMPRLVHRHMMGTLNMNNELDRYFEEFVRHGGETGYTAINSIEHYKRNIKRSVKDAQGKLGMTKKAWNGVFDAIEFMNRSAENMTRFAVYVTSREMGRDQARAAHDAKEITVNFNKKGSGELGARYLGGLYVFMNACIQSMANFARLTGKHPVKMTGALATMAGLGFMLPLLNRMLAEAMGDDDEYWNLPEWVRRNNLVFRIPGTNKFITIPISHELRPFYGIGEIAYSVMNEKEDAKEGLGKAMLGFSGMSPIDFTGNGGNVAVNLTPTAFQPVAQLVANVDYFGKPIFKDADYLEDYPEYTKVYKGTSPMLVSGTEFLNRVSGGDVVVAGGIDLNPDVIEHLVESYFGGAGKTANKAIKGFTMIWDEDTREVRNIPIVSKFLQTAEERTYGSHTQKEFYEAMDKVEDTGHKLSGYGKQATMGSIEYAEKLNELINSPEYKEYKLAMGYKSAIKKLQNSLGNIDKTKEKEVSEAIQRLQKEMLEELPKTKAQDIDTVLDNAEEVKWGAEEKVESIFGSSVDDFYNRKDAVNDAKEYGDTTALKQFIESGRGKDNK